MVTEKGQSEVSVLSTQCIWFSFIWSHSTKPSIGLGVRYLFQCAVLYNKGAPDWLLKAYSHSARRPLIYSERYRRRLNHLRLWLSRKADYRVNLDTFAEYLLNQNDSNTEDFNMLAGYDIHEIEEILSKRAFVCGDRIITTFDGLRDYLDRFIYRLLPAYHPTLPGPDSLNMELHFHLLTVDDSKNRFKLKTKFLIIASWTAGLAEGRFPGQRPDSIPVCS